MRVMRLAILLVLISAGLFAPAPAPERVMAQAGPADPPAGRLMYDGVFDLPRLDGVTAAAQSPAASLPPEYAATTRLAFQSLRNQQDWEVFVAAGDGTQQVNVASSSASEIYPRLNPAATRLAFSSNRYGFYGLYLANPDGSDVQRIRYESGDSVYPSWSPDGERLVFQGQADPNGPADLYVMDSHGGGATPLTDYADYDGEPAWSPDGKQIAFTRRANGQYRIWVMNADGSGARQLSQQPNSEHAAWSPDGRWIAYDADGNGDGWMELWLMDAAGGNQHMIYRPPVNEADAMGGSWSPDGRYLAFTHVSWVFYQGDWYWTTAFIDALPVWTSGEVKRVVGVGADFFPDWRAKDLQPPTSAVLPLPTYSRASGFTVNWQGHDVGLSGLMGYDVEYRSGASGAWMPWLTQTQKTSETFTSTGGQTVSFRVRGRDGAGNVEPWSAGDLADASTTAFSWLLGGRLTDNRGIPIGRAPVAIDPAPVIGTETGSDGRFSTYLAATGDHSIAVARSGYAPLMFSPIAGDQDRTVEAYLAPLGNVVVNGGFEDGFTLPFSWSVSGPDGAVVRTALPHTGRQALQLGVTCHAPCLSPAVPLDPSLGTSNPDLAADSEGNLYLVSAGYDGGTLVARFAVRSRSGQWTDPETLGALVYDDARVGVAVDGRDTVHVAWPGPDGLYYRNRPKGGAWSVPERFAQDANSLDMAADSLGGIHVIYYTLSGWQSDVKYSERLSSGQWQPAISLDEGEGSIFPGIAVGADNSVHVIYQDVAAGNAGVFYRSRPHDGAMSPAERVGSGFGISYQQHLAVDRDGTVHAVFGWSDAFYTRKPAGAAWTVPEVFPDARGPVIALDGAGTLHLVGLSGYGPYTLAYRSRTPDGTWRPGSLIADSYTDSYAVTTDGAGVFHLVGLANSRLNHWTTLRTSEAFTATASQRVTIPADMHQPTLSANYVFTVGGARFSMVVDDGLDRTEVFSDTEGTSWQLAWADLSPWAGRQVTVTLALTQAAGAPYSQVRLDDVTLGEWPTPVIRSVEPARVDARTSAHIVFHGDNLVDKPSVKVGSVDLQDVVWVDEHTLKATLPPLPPGIYDLWVTNPGGAANVLGDAFRSGLPVYMPVSAR